MSDLWQLRVYEQNKRVCTADLTGPAELGRQTALEETLYTPRLAAGRHRVAIAPKDERSTSRQQILVEPRPDGSFLVTNIGGERPITLPDGSDLLPKDQRVVAAEGMLRLGQKAIRLSRSDNRKSSLQSLSDATMAPGKYSGGVGSLPALRARERGRREPEAVAAMAPRRRRRPAERGGVGRLLRQGRPRGRGPGPPGLGPGVAPPSRTSGSWRRITPRSGATAGSRTPPATTCSRRSARRRRRSGRCPTPASTPRRACSRSRRSSPRRSSTARAR